MNLYFEIFLVKFKHSILILMIVYLSKLLKINKKNIYNFIEVTQNRLGYFFK